MVTPKILAAALVALASTLASPSANALVSLPLPPVNRPSPPPGWAYQWVAPVYRTIVDRVWVPGRTQLVPDWIQIGDHWEQVWREITTPGHYESTTRQILVSDGHWQLVRVEPPRPVPFPRPVIIVPANPSTVSVNGYSSGPTEDLHAFSPLYEWPDRKN